MNIKQIKEAKNQLTSNLKKILQDFVSGGDIHVEISDDMETIEATIQTVVPKDDATIVYVTNLLTYNVNNSDNIAFSGSNRTVLTTKDGLVAGVVSNSSKIDLWTLYSLKEVIYNFCLDNKLIEKESESIAVPTEY